MFDLVKFELKKIIARPSTRYTCLAVVLALCAIMTLNVLQTKTTSNTEEILSGFDAIHQRQAAAEEHAGVLSGDRVAEEVAAYYDLAFSELDPSEIASMSNAAAYDAVSLTYDDETWSELYGAGYYPWLFSAWNSGGKEPIQVSALLGPDPEVPFYDAIEEKVQATLDDGQEGSWVYSDAERAFWTNKQQQVAEPLSYGYAGGWENIMDCIAFAAFAMIAVCVGLAPMFAGEYRERTDSVLLASRYGRTKLIGAKLAASFVFATAVFAVCAGIICGVSLGAYGAGGGSLPVQVMALSSPYALTMAQCAGIMAGLAYLITLGFAALTLLLSSVLRSVLSIFAIDVALVLLTGMVPTGGLGILTHLVVLFPTSGLVAPTMFWRYMSYPLGGLVLDHPAMMALVYGVMVLACVPLSAWAFRRHEVA